MIKGVLHTVEQEIKEVTPQEIPALCEMAKRLWVEHYTPILPQGQPEYMVDKFQSEPAIRHQVESEGYQYFWLIQDGRPAGYTAIQPQKDGSLFLSKIYVDKAYRRNGLASMAVERFRNLCREKGYTKLWLTVNRLNQGSIAAYKKLGFIKTRSQVADIGQGYVMDDDIMEWKNAG